MPTPPEQTSANDDGLVVRGPDEEPAAPPPPGRKLAGFAREIALTALAAVALWVGAGWLRAPDLPEQAPDFALIDLDGHEWRLSELRGRTVVLNFWATWCGPCRMEAPGLSSFAAAHPDIPVLGVAVDGTPDALRVAVRELGIEYPVLRIDAPTRAAYNVQTLPTTVVVAPDGSVRASHSGLMVQPHLALLTR